jgi:hypothetical protein
MPTYDESNNARQSGEERGSILSHFVLQPCANAIRDGVIEATINHEAGHLFSSEVLNIYSTIEPQQAFHPRMKFCLAMHDAVKAMRYPSEAHKIKSTTLATNE